MSAGAVAALSVFAAAPPAFAARERPAPGRLGVMTYNIHWAEPVDGRTGRRVGWATLRRVVRDIVRSGAELVALHEAQSYRLGGRRWSQPRQIARALGWVRGGVASHVLWAPARPAAVWCRRRDGRPVVRRLGRRRGSCIGHGNALISRRPLRARRRVDLPTGGLEGRNVLEARIRLRDGPLWVYATHLQRGARLAACQLRDVLSRSLGRRPAVLLADLNLEPDSEVRDPPCSGLPPLPLDMLWTAGFRGARFPVPTYPAHRPREAIDHIFTAGGVAAVSARALDNCVRLADTGRALCSSDHRPYVATVRRRAG